MVQHEGEGGRRIVGAIDFAIPELDSEGSFLRRPENKLQRSTCGFELTGGFRVDRGSGSWRLVSVRNFGSLCWVVCQAAACPCLLAINTSTHVAMHSMSARGANVVHEPTLHKSRSGRGARSGSGNICGQKAIPNVLA